ncbi:class I lanthipeptide [Reichenbachiella faecimaris]|uniref:class I lanthipeptide n=1 Tax=Reichenbachiella faecimaris TaxID=692418 RepID=UPI000A0295B4|nr:class I lanthipeptide [Reichenbachiella faecimaris]
MKKSNKKLTLNKETVSKLNDEQMEEIKGGYFHILSIGARCQRSRMLTHHTSC